MEAMMKCLAACGLLMLAGVSSTVAQEEGEVKGEAPAIVPVEIYICNFNEAKGPEDLNQWAEKWNAWIDSTSSAPEPYSAWTLTPFYFGPDQDFDFIWLGTSPNATALGRAYDNWLNNSGTLQADFNQVATCETHSNFAALPIKEPAEREGTAPFVLSFSDCNVADDKTIDDVMPAMRAWGEYRSAHGSGAGMWVLFPAYGGGGAEFDFKFVVSHRNHEALGADYDQYTQGGYTKAAELFSGVVDCDESRAYNAVWKRDGIPDDG